MSGFQEHDWDFSRYNYISIKELENILRADFELPEEESDMEKILYITEVIVGRRAGQTTGRYANADEVWESFVENYIPDEKTSGFLIEEKECRGTRGRHEKGKAPVLENRADVDDLHRGGECVGGCCQYRHSVLVWVRFLGVAHRVDAEGIWSS